MALSTPLDKKPFPVAIISAGEHHESFWIVFDELKRLESEGFDVEGIDVRKKLVRSPKHMGWVGYKEDGTFDTTCRSVCMQSGFTELVSDVVDTMIHYVALDADRGDSQEYNALGAVPFFLVCLMLCSTSVPR